MSSETRDTLLYGQMQRYEIMKAPAVFGTLQYPELCIAAKNEEKCLVNYARDNNTQSKVIRQGPSRLQII